MILRRNSWKLPITLIANLLFTVSVHAENGDAALAIVQSAAASGEPVERITVVGTQIQHIFGSVYKMLFTIGVCIAATGMIIAFTEIGLSKKGRLRESAKWKLVGIAAALILIGGATTFVNLFIQLLT